MLATAAVGASGQAVALSRSFKRFLLAVLIVSILWALGGNTPFYKLVLWIVPGTKYFRAPSTMMYVSALAATLFAAVGAHRVLAGDVKRPWLVGWGLTALVIAILGVTGGLTNLAESIGQQMFASYRPDLAQYYTVQTLERIDANAGALAFGSVRAMVFVVIALGMFSAAAHERIGPRRVAFAMLALVVADLWLVERKYWGFSPRASVMYGSDAAIDYLKIRRDSARVLAMPLSRNYEYHDAMLLGDGLMVHGIRQATGYHGNEIGRYGRLTGNGVTSDGIRSLLNVKYLLTNVVPTDTLLRNAFGGAQPRFVAGPARNAPGTMVYLYELPGADAGAWVASVALKAPDDNVLATLQDARFDATMQRRVALTDTASTSPAVQGAADIPAPSTITARVQRPNHSRITIELSAPARDGNVLVVSENFYPGWVATVDGRAAEAERVDYTLIGVPLRAGDRRVELQFTSSSSRTGLLITLAATLASLALVALDWHRRRRTLTSAGAVSG